MSSYNSSTPNALGNLNSFDSTVPGAGAAFAQSLDSIGMCYWYAKVPKNGPADSGFALDNADGSPNLGIRNNLIARAGVPLTNNVLSLNEVLQAMHDAGGELKRMQGEISSAAVKMNDVLLQGVASSGLLSAAGMGGAAAVGIGYKAAGRERVVKTARWFSSRLAPIGDVGTGTIYSLPALRKALQTGVSKPRPPVRFSNLNGVPHALKTYHITDPSGKTTHLVELAVDESGEVKWRAVQRGVKGELGNINKARFLRATDNTLQRLKLDPKEVRAMTSNLNQEIRLSALTAKNSSLAFGKSVAKKAFNGTVNFCGNGSKPLVKLACTAAVAAAVFTPLAVSKLAGANKAKSNDVEVASAVQSVLNNPQIAANVSAIMAKLEKETLITPELMEALRKQLLARSEKSTRGTCIQTFGTEILTTPGVADAGYDVGSSGGFTPPTSSGYTPSLQPATDPNATLPSLPVTPSDSLQGIPSDSSVSSDPAFDSGSGTDSSSMDPSTLPPIPADQQDTSSSSTTTDDPSALDSSLDGTSSGSGDPTSL